MIIECEFCYGRGLVFLGDNNDYAIEPCECVLQDNETELLSDPSDTIQ